MGKHLRKAQAKLGARRVAHKARETDARDQAKMRASTDKTPGSMKWK